MQLRTWRGFAAVGAVITIAVFALSPATPPKVKAETMTPDVLALAGAVGQLTRAFTDFRVDLASHGRDEDARIVAIESAIKTETDAIDKLVRTMEERERARWPR